MNFVLIRKKNRHVFYVTAVTVVTEENTLSTEIFGLPLTHAETLLGTFSQLQTIQTEGH